MSSYLSGDIILNQHNDRAHVGDVQRYIMTIILFRQIMLLFVFSMNFLFIRNFKMGFENQWQYCHPSFCFVSRAILPH